MFGGAGSFFTPKMFFLRYYGVKRQSMRKDRVNPVAQNLNAGAGDEGGKLLYGGVSKAAEEMAAEGIVLLKNENDALPLRKDDRVALFGRCAWNYFAVGYGSGGDVRRPYVVNAVEGLRRKNVSLDCDLCAKYESWIGKPENTPVPDGIWGHWPMSLSEMSLSPDDVRKASLRNTIALVVIGRAAGEDRDNRLEKGSYYLTDDECDLLDKVTAYFSRTVVIIDAGNIIDMSWSVKYGRRISAVLYAWQGGMESGSALADILTGDITPSGKLTATIASSYDRYPSSRSFGGLEYNSYSEDIYVGYRYFETFRKDDVLYPFGYGLSYTTFSISSTAVRKGDSVTVTATVRNTGKRNGKEVVQVYLEKPQGTLGNPSRILTSYAKTKLLTPGEKESVSLTFSLSSWASFSENESAFILEEGDYSVHTGNSVRNTEKILTFHIDRTRTVKNVERVLLVKKGCEFERIVNENGKSVMKMTDSGDSNLRKRILSSLPHEIVKKDDEDYTFSSVKSGKCTLEEFTAGLTMSQLEALTRGEGKMDCNLGIEGNAGAFGGVTEELRKKGIPVVITADGPAGIRIKRTCSLLPSGTALASSFNDRGVGNLYSYIAAEMKAYGVDMLLAPGMNIHRNPLAGRNFEYFSEDPYLSGSIAAAVVNALQGSGVFCSPKHFAANNQETARTENDSRVSVRALREIYLRNFEVMIRKSHPRAIMTSYNRINGVWCHYGYELVETVLRHELGFDGVVITDWWMHRASSPEFPALTNDAYRVRSTVDVLMPGGDGYSESNTVGRTLLDTYGSEDGITKGEIQNAAMRVLRFLLEKSER